MSKNVREIRRMMAAEGVAVLQIRTDKRHLHIITKRGLFIAPKTPSSRYWMKRLRALVRQNLANDN